MSYCSAILTLKKGVKMDEDIPKTTIVVLLVLTVLISVACTWVVLDKTMNAEFGYVMDEDESSGKVKINIGTGGEELSAPVASITGESVSNVAIKIR